MAYFDVDVEAVAAAGRRTAATAATWEAWASRTANVLRNSAGEAQDSTVTGALEGYLSGLNPTMRSLAKQVDALGGNAVAAAHTVANSDTHAAALLSGAGRRTDGTTSALRRPINP
ncbi:MAG TPA: hypothetical protein VFC00_04785 [Micromonosporaceae bacterium]|nr:hypothetical protein [Micromonosporaceae bacterium]